MANRVDTNQIDEQMIVGLVRSDRLPMKEITPQPLGPLAATVPAGSDEPAKQDTQPKQEETPYDEIPVSPPEPQKEETRSKRAGHQEYETIFMRETDLPPARFGKSVYIRKDYHDRISQIISVIGGNEVSLFGYIDNVLAHHFENFRDDIARSFKKKIIFK
jgi:hypothetical protein